MGNNKEKILNLYFTNKLRVVDIANELNISKSAVTQVLQKDERYPKEKEIRKNQNKEKNIEFTKKYIAKKRSERNSEMDYLILKHLHEQASLELSGGKRPINNIAFRDWNSSIYRYNNKNKSYVLREGIVVGSDVPKTIKWNTY